MTCRACGSARLSTVFAMDPMPLAGAFTRTEFEARAATRYPLEWRWCEACGLVNVWPDIPDEDIYTDYSYRASDVPALVEHHKAFAKWLVERWPRSDVRFLEVGGNDGVLTRNLPRMWDVTNVDPSDVGGGRGHIKDAWPTGFYGEYDLVTSSNAFAHFSEIGRGLAAVSAVLADGGEFVMEVHDLYATLATGQWDTVYHEHKVEWSVNSLVIAGAANGLELIHLERHALHGGLLRAVFRRGPVRAPQQPVRPSFSKLARLYRERQPVGADMAYGAAARATVYLNQVHEPITAIIDGSPRRYGRFVPGTGTPILPPTSMPTDGRILVTAWTQAEFIKARHPGFRGEWVTAW